jgi:transcriptional regulator with XRE-family HTH domain
MASNDGNAAATHFGRQMKKERLAHGWSLRELSNRTGIDFATLSRVENGKRPPTEKLANACDRVWPGRRGWFSEYYEESKSWVPAGFRSWAEYEDKAASIRVWSPGILTGLIQTPDYAHAVLSVSTGVTPEVVASRLAARMERQRHALYRDDPPRAWFVIDEFALYRLVGSPEIMAAQMSQLATVAAMPNVTLTVMPPVLHPANESGFVVTDDAAYAEHVAGGFVYTDEQIVSSLAMRFDRLRAESRRASESLALIERMEQTWTTGVRAATAGRTAASASRSRQATA